MKSADSILSSIPRNRDFTTLGMTPIFSSSLRSYPLPIVYVFPDPVWPYAKTVALYPKNEKFKLFHLGTLFHWEILNWYWCPLMLK